MNGKSAFDNSEDFALADDQQVFAVNFHSVAAGVRAEHNLVTHFHGQRTHFTVVQNFAWAYSEDFALVWLFSSRTLRRMTTRSCRGRSFIVDLS
jgi:hypothetical protein